MNKKHLHVAVIFDGENLNYGESLGNMAQLKKIFRNGKQWSMASRQCLRYDIVRIMEEQYHINQTPVSGDSGVVQYDPKTTIRDYPEIDLFGYMITKTKEKKGNKKENTEGEPAEEGATEPRTRKAVVRVNSAISMQPYMNDMEFGNNLGMMRRLDPTGNGGSDIFNRELHHSLYCYDITIDLEKLGVDGDISLPKEERIKRMEMFLDAIFKLYRGIKGGESNLSPVFIIGGLYSDGNPSFTKRIRLKDNASDKLDTDLINSVLDNMDIGGDTLVGYLGEYFKNVQTINVPKKLSIKDFFSELKGKVGEYYNGSN